MPSFKTDHSAFFVSLKLNRNQRGVGYWKLNTELLKNPKIIEEINETISSIIESNAMAHPCNTWELIKTRVVKVFKEKGKRIKSENQLIISQLF